MPATRKSELRIRILAGSAIAMGPGKADLLRAIEHTGSISAAARVMKMSYRRAWLLVDTMNRSFSEPLVEAVKGGTSGGGARLTAAGEKILSIYGETVAFARQRFAPYLPHSPSSRRKRPAR